MNATTRKTRWGLWVFLAIIALGIGGLLRAGIVRLPGHVLGAPKVALSIANNFAPVSLGEFNNGYASVIDPDLPAVVNISSTKMVKSQVISPDFFNDPLFQQFFGGQSAPPSNQQPQTERESSLGSGIIVNSDGYILTNNHVVSEASDIEVLTQDRRKFKAKVIGTDPRTDVAVLKIDAARPDHR